MGEQYIDKESLILIRARLWAISKEKEIALEDIQDRTGFSYSQVYRIVRGENNMSVSGLIAVCKALEIQPIEVLNFTINIPKHKPTRRNFNWYQWKMYFVNRDILKFQFKDYLMILALSGHIWVKWNISVWVTGKPFLYFKTRLSP